MTPALLLALLAPLALASPLEVRDSHSDCSTAPFSSSPKVSTPLSTVANLGPYSPFISQTSPFCRDVPSGLSVDQVYVVSRHGARSPTAKDLVKKQAVVDKLKKATAVDKSWAFLKNYSLAGYAADALTDYGRKQMYDQGVALRQRYRHLGKSAFTRVAGQDRVVESGQYWLQGFSGSKFKIYNDTSKLPHADVWITEEEGLNNTLAVTNCAAAETDEADYGAIAEDNWREVFATPIVERLKTALTGVNLTISDVQHMMSMCGFDAIKGAEYAAADFCKVFTAAEWEQNEYYYDVSKYWGGGHGNPYAKTMFSGWVNELVARLTDKPVHMAGAVNTTLDSSAATFPLGRPFYADFSHDNDMVGMLAALGVFPEAGLPTKASVDAIPRHYFNVARLVPFAGRIVVERLGGSGMKGSSGAKYVRVLVNDAVVPLPFPGCGAYQWAGLCELDAFVAAQSYAAEEPKHWDALCPATPLTVQVAE